MCRYYPPLESVLVDLGVSWFYNWRPTASEESIVPPPGVEFVPMVASADDVNATILEGLKQEPSPNLLGFNEPDILSQNPTSVSRAIALWPQLEATGKRLGSPATAFKPLQSPWFDDFMNQAARQGLRVDFLNVHYFAENTNRWNVRTAVEDMRIFLKNIYQRYQKPIWVTEFSLIKWFPQPYTCPQAERQASSNYNFSEHLEQ